MSQTPSTPANRELVLTRDLDVAPERLFRTWIQRLPEWWAPRPWTTPVCEMDLRVGGVLRTVMRAPDGREFPTSGVFLEIVPNRRIVFTDAYDAGWVPGANPFFTAVVTFDPLAGGGTRYTARARHWTGEDCRKHEAMGFPTGWSQVLDQLVALAKQA
jgi:uncharacterized protein YndB with AHSA1/START domain